MDVTHFTHTVKCDGLSVQYDLCCPGKSGAGKFPCENFSIDEALSYEQKIVAFEKAYGETLEEIERLTNTADGLDYTIAVASGIIAGLIDLVWVGEFSIDRANEWGNQKVKKFVVWVAQKQGYKGGDDDLAGAVGYLEDLFPIAADKATNNFGGGKQHHLRDFSHHPTPVGLFFSLLTQFTGNVYGTDVAGVFRIAPLSAGDFHLIGKNVPEKITFGVVHWFFHMVSDMAGSSDSIIDGKLGTGLPGPIVSLLKELSALPIFHHTNEKGYKEFSVWISKLFNGTLLAKRDVNGNIEAVKFDLRTEIGVAQELGRQAMPVVINEGVVRAFYFIRRLFVELKENDVRSIAELQKINWKDTLPTKNRTIVRMLTISTGVMEVMDLVDAGVRSGGALPVFLLRVNFVGVGRFAIAGSADIMMGVKKERLELAMASAEVAKTAKVLTSTISSVDNQRKQTRQLLNEVTAEINEHPGRVRRKSMGYTIHDIQVDTDIFTLEDVREASNQIFYLQENEFNAIRNKKWYYDFKRAITFHADDRKKIISDITSISKLQQLFMLVYARYFKSLDADLAKNIAVVGKLNQKVYKLYETCVAKVELQDDIRSFDPHERAILHLFLFEYNSQNRNEDKFRRYRRQILRLFGDVESTSTFDATQLGTIRHPETFYRCACELCAIDGDLNDRQFPVEIVAALNELALAPNKRKKIEDSVIEQADKLGTDYFLDDKYQSTDFSTDGITLEDPQENVSYDCPHEEVSADSLTGKRIYISTPKNSIEKNAAERLSLMLKNARCKLEKKPDDAHYQIYFPSSNAAERASIIANSSLYENDYGCTILRSKMGGSYICLKYSLPDSITDAFRKAIIDAYEDQTDDTDLEKAINTWSANHAPKDKSEYLTHKAKVAVDDASQAVKHFSEDLLRAKAKDKKSVLPTIGKKVGGGVLRVGSAIAQGVNNGSYWVNSKIEAAGDKGKTTLADAEFDKKVIPAVQCKILVKKLFDLLATGDL